MAYRLASLIDISRKLRTDLSPLIYLIEKQFLIIYVIIKAFNDDYDLLTFGIYSMAFKTILDTVGHTPLVYFPNFSKDLELDIFGKLENQNPGKSLKDRSSKFIIQKALETGQILSDTTIIESSSGNMAVGLARICKIYGLKLILVVDPNINETTLKLIKIYGAETEMVYRKDASNSYLQARLQRVKELLKMLPNSYTTNQYENPHNPLSQSQIYREIVFDLKGDPDYIFVSVSTCGTIKGISNEINGSGSSARVVAIDAVGSMIFSDQHKNRKIPGMGASKKPSFNIEKEVDAFFLVEESDSIEGCNLLLDKEVVLAGGSSGAQVSALYKNSHLFPKGSTICLIIADDGERYIDTIYNHQWLEQNYSSYDLETISAE